MAEVDLLKEFTPCGTYFPDGDRYEILTKDTANFVRHISGSSVYLLIDMETNEIVGMGVDNARKTFE